MLRGSAAKWPKNKKVLVTGVQHVEAHPVVIGKPSGDDSGAELLKRSEIFGPLGETPDFRDDVMKGWVWHSSIPYYLRSGKFHETERRRVA
jgi:hypothetical protein